jgi:hypothetical protein
MALKLCDSRRRKPGAFMKKGEEKEEKERGKKDTSLFR